MATYITVLNSSVNNRYWKAVQVAESLQAILNNRYYTAGVSTSFPKKEGDIFVQDKQVTETSTQLTANAKVFKLDMQTSDAMKIMSGKASANLIKKMKNRK